MRRIGIAIDPALACSNAHGWAVLPLRAPVLLLRVNEAPDFIDLDAAALKVAEMGVLVSPERLSSIDNEFGDGVFADAC